MYWTTTVLIALASIVAGIGNLLPFKHISEVMSHLGYPPYFLDILGTWKILAAITILIPGAKRLKEWAYAGIFIDLSGAILSHFSLHDGWQKIIVPFFILSLAMISWVFRPRERTLLPIN